MNSLSHTVAWASRDSTATSGLSQSIRGIQGRHGGQLRYLSVQKCPENVQSIFSLYDAMGDGFVVESPAGRHPSLAYRKSLPRWDI